ncbi:hypothetical protein N0V84_000200 [Fusarium piperis]|uniref:Antifungal protein n=1 Tax=Fusarium piperis TaxID=1435070 RepID=A0A9W8WNC8_9HYPO|nr:hypothetical protein N0V84_000200 [Fusarium piperis]
MCSPVKLFVAIMAFTTVTAAMPAADNADKQDLEARGGCLGYANYAKCIAGRRRLCQPGSGQSSCFNNAQLVCQANY